MRKSIVVLAALAVMVATPAAAVEPEAVMVEVPYADLDLSAPAGAATLDARIDAAVEEVCARPDIRNLKAMTAWEACKESARLGAMEQLSVLAPYEAMALAGVF